MRQVIVVTDAVTHASSAQLDSATAKFTWRDQGRPIIDVDQAHIPVGAYIKEILGPTTVIMSAVSVAAGTGITAMFHRFTYTVSVTDAVKTDGLNVITSATGTFTNDDNGALVTGTGIPSDCYIQSHGDGTLLLTKPVTGSGTFTLTINRFESEPLWEADMLMDRARDVVRDLSRATQRASSAISSDGANDILIRLNSIAQDYNLSNPTNRPVMTIDMKSAAAATGDGAAAHTAFNALGNTTSGTNYT